VPGNDNAYSGEVSQEGHRRTKRFALDHPQQACVGATGGDLRVTNPATRPIITHLPLEEFMEYFRLNHPPDRPILCNRSNCEKVADYLEVNEHRGEYFACAVHTSSEKHVIVLPNFARYDSRPASLPALEIEKSQAEVICSICDKQVTLQEDTCLDENGKTVHTDCHGSKFCKTTVRLRALLLDYKKGDAA
jgi:hypothetical protein